MYGEGEMYKRDQMLADNQAIKEHIAKLPTKPRLPKNADGNVEEYYKGDRRGECTERPIIYNLSDYDFSMFLKSNRMTPKFEPGDELFFKETDCLKAGGSEPEWGDEFLLDTKNGLRFKRIYPAVNEAGEKCIRCVSYNKEEYPDFLVSIKSIRAVYRYIGALRIK
jgi:phage repressor protein C with HTH and peptisase S24 domain